MHVFVLLTVCCLNCSKDQMMMMMRTVLLCVIGVVIACFIHTTNSASWTPLACEYYEQTTGCTNVDVPPCNVPKKTCYAHANVCGSFRNILLNPIFTNNWTLYSSPYTFQCLDSTPPADCINETLIMQYPLLPTGNPSHCIPLGIQIYSSNITIATLGTDNVHQSRIYTPVPQPGTTVCSVLQFANGNIRAVRLDVDGTNCFSQPGTFTRGVTIAGNGYYPQSLRFLNVNEGHSASGCDQIIFDGITVLDSVYINPFFNLWILATTSPNCTGYITSTSYLDYAVITYGSNTVVNNTTLQTFDFSLFQSNYGSGLLAPTPPPCPSCSQSSNSGAGLTNYQWLGVGISISAAILIVFGVAWAIKKADIHNAKYE